jgi:proteasome lid subunit RPN8/RPN11
MKRTKRKTKKMKKMKTRFNQVEKELRVDYDPITFIPHEAKTEILYSGDTPRIFVKPEALVKMGAIVELADEEVSWYCSVEEAGTDYIITGAFLVGQEAGPAEVEHTTDGQVALAEELLSTPGGRDIILKLRGWGHSHVDMSTNPSAEDCKTFSEFIATGKPFSIRLICNKKGHMEWTVYRASDNLIFRDVRWFPYLPEMLDKEGLAKEVSEKVKKAPARADSYRGGYFNGNRSSKATYDDTDYQPGEDGYDDPLSPDVVRSLLGRPSGSAVQSSVPLVGGDSESVEDVINQQKLPKR